MKLPAKLIRVEAELLERRKRYDGKGEMWRAADYSRSQGYVFQCRLVQTETSRYFKPA